MQQMSELQQCLYQVWGGEASHTNAPEDLPEVDTYIKKEVLAMSDDEVKKTLIKDWDINPDEWED